MQQTRLIASSFSSNALYSETRCGVKPLCAGGTYLSTFRMWKPLLPQTMNTRSRYGLFALLQRSHHIVLVSIMASCVLAWFNREFVPWVYPDSVEFVNNTLHISVRKSWTPEPDYFLGRYLCHHNSVGVDGGNQSGASSCSFEQFRLVRVDNTLSVPHRGDVLRVAFLATQENNDSKAPSSKSHEVVSDWVFTPLAMC